MAAHLEGKAASAYDMTGLSQKNGAVFSHLKIGTNLDQIYAQRIGLGEASLILGFDMVAALADEAFRTANAEHTKFIGNSRVQPTAALNFNPDDRIDTSLLNARLKEKLNDENIAMIDATSVALALLGDTIAANMFIVGFAAQKGWLPVGLEALERAIELNGVQIPFNKQALAMGRQWAVNPDVFKAQLQPKSAAPVRLANLDDIVAHRKDMLAKYQDAAYAARYQALVDLAIAAEQKVAPGKQRLAKAVARYFAKVMAYKDEYEVARLYADPDFKQVIEQQFDGQDMRLAFNLAPPLLSRRDPETGNLVKQEYGQWVTWLFPVLAAMRKYRGTWLDVFGRTTERRSERELVGRYEGHLTELLPNLSEANYETVIKIALLPEQIRGFGHVKEANMIKVHAEESRLLEELREIEQNREPLATAV